MNMSSASVSCFFSLREWYSLPQMCLFNRKRSINSFSATVNQQQSKKWMGCQGPSCHGWEYHLSWVGSEVICRIFEILEKKEVPSSLCKLFISFSFFAPEGKILDRSSQKTFILLQNAYLHCLCNVHHSDLIAQTFVFF